MIRPTLGYAQLIMGISRRGRVTYSIRCCWVTLVTKSVNNIDMAASVDAQCNKSQELVVRQVEPNIRSVRKKKP